MKRVFLSRFRQSQKQLKTLSFSSCYLAAIHTEWMKKLTSSTKTLTHQEAFDLMGPHLQKALNKYPHELRQAWQQPQALQEMINYRLKHGSFQTPSKNYVQQFKQVSGQVFVSLLGLKIIVFLFTQYLWLTLGVFLFLHYWSEC